MTRFAPFLVLVALGAAIVTACGLLAPAHSPRADAFDCRQAALEPIFGEILDTKALLRDLYAGKADLRAALTAAEATQAEFMVLMQAWTACESPEPAPSVPDAGLTPS